MSLNKNKKTILIDSGISDCKIITCIDSEQNEIIDIACERDDVVQLKNNIYLGKVTRVEPSLQAAFVTYDDKKYGFIPFHDIHPDYYQIPAIDKAKIDLKIKELNQHNEFQGASLTDESTEDLKHEIYKHYQMQEVVKRNQPLLVQVNKDERGNKNVSLTTYITLSGRYIVFMPNNIKNILISKKITDKSERLRIKKIISSINLRDDYCIIARTSICGASEKEIKDDYNYLFNLWNDITKKTIKSKIPSLIHKDDDVIQRKIKNYLNKNTDKIVISSDLEYFNKISSFAFNILNEKFNILHYKDEVPLFKKYKIDKKIDELLNDRVNLASGGYLIINHTEALISVDVNSGKATAEKNIEETALKINLEASEEISRQIRLRNLGGLIIIDFIDMLKLDNKKTVEKRFSELILDDKAKIQISRISNFGLMEISRQRLGTSLRDILGNICHYCNGNGYLKSQLLILHMITNSIYENQDKLKNKDILIKCSNSIKIYIKSNFESKIQEIKKIVKFNKISIEEKIYYAVDRFSISAKSESDKEYKTISSNNYHVINDLIKIRELKESNKNKNPIMIASKYNFTLIYKVAFYPLFLAYKIIKSTCKLFSFAFLKKENKPKQRRYMKNYNVKKRRNRK